MPRLSRRRFLFISAATLAARPAMAAPVRRWTGTALGARASITLDHPEADRIVNSALQEIDRLESVFSLYRPGSALSVLNRTGSIEAPPFELVECLGIAGAVHAASGGAFDPTIQPLWAAYAEAHANGAAPTEETLAEAMSRAGWSGVSVSPSRISFDRPGMALTLNGIAQGYVADRVARLFETEGLGNILIDTGELRALGGRPAGGAWPVTLASGGTFALRNRALATSAPGGTTFDLAGSVGHMIDPRTGRPAMASGRSVTVSAPTAALADALSTAACILVDTARIQAALGAFRECQLV